ncbi:MAG TPA: class F sortase [Actinopolymorphaceae bacterium]
MKRAPDQATGRAGGSRGKPRRAAGLALVVLSAITGTVLLVLAFVAGPPQPPQPDPAAAPTNLPIVSGTWDPTVTPAPTTPPSTPEGAPTAGQDTPTAGQGTPTADQGTLTTDQRTKPTPTTSPTPTPQPKRIGLGRSTPVRIRIPKIDVNARIMKLGLKRDRTLQVPPDDKAYLAGWYRLGPTPGEVGNSVIVGHVDSKKLGPAVFFRLGELRPGDVIYVTRKNGSVAKFVVDGVKAYRKTRFPTQLVYGPSNVPGLRLVTCGGPWSKENSYRDNVIVFATLASARR